MASWERVTPSARPPKLTFRDQSTFNINAQNAVLGTSTARPGTEGEEYPPASIEFLTKAWQMETPNMDCGTPPLWQQCCHGKCNRRLHELQFFDDSTLNLNAERAAAYIYMRGRSVMNANVAEALGSEGGYSPTFEFHDNSTLNANAAQAVSARPRFYDGSKFVLASENAPVESHFRASTGGGYFVSSIDFHDNSTMEINAPRAIGPAGYKPDVPIWDRLWFQDSSTLNLNGEDVLRTANWWDIYFKDSTTLNINAAQNFHDDRELLHGANVSMARGGTINANVADSIYGYFTIGGALNAKAAEAVSGGRIRVGGNLNALVPRAITGGQQIIGGVLHATATHTVDGGRIVAEDGRIEVEAHNALSTNAVIEFGTEYTNGACCI